MVVGDCIQIHLMDGIIRDLESFLFSALCVFFFVFFNPMCVISGGKMAAAIPGIVDTFQAGTRGKRQHSALSLL